MTPEQRRDTLKWAILSGAGTGGAAALAFRTGHPVFGVLLATMAVGSALNVGALLRWRGPA